MSRLILRSEKCNWQSPFRSGGSLELMKMEYDGKQWYKIIAVGPEMKDNFLNFGIPTNIDHIEFLEDATDLFDDILSGPNSRGNLSVSKFWSEKSRNGLLGHTSNVYIDNNLCVGEETVTGCVQTGDSVKRWAGPGGIISLNAKSIKEKAKRLGISEEAAWNYTIRHEFKHFDDHLKGREKSDESEAVHEGFEAMLESGAEIDARVIMAYLKRYDIESSWATKMVKKWVREWEKKYSDFCFHGEDSNVMYLETPWLNVIGCDISHDEERDLSDEDLARERGLWNDEDEEENNVDT